MIKTFTCKNCQETIKKNPRLKCPQHYCGKSACQRSRKNAWARDKYLQNSNYRKEKKKFNKQWRDKHPADKYQRTYRNKHPDYKIENRKSQIKRNQNRKSSSDKIMNIPTNSRNNTQSFTVQKDCKDGHVIQESLIQEGLYAILPYNPDTRQKIVKMDALIVQLSNLKYDNSDFF